MKIERSAALWASMLWIAGATGCRTGETEPPDGQTASSGDTQAEAGEAGEASAPPGYPGELVPTQELAGEFMARQKLAIRFEEREFKFEAVMQLVDGKLTVLGLTPFGTKAFVLTQEGTEVGFEPLMEREMPFPPEYILQDIHRAWLWSARLPWGETAPPEGSASVEVAGERVREQWGDDGLERRSFERLDGQPPGVISVEYVGGHLPGKPAKEVLLDNGWFGYRLKIVTTQWRELG